MPQLEAIRDAYAARADEYTAVLGSVADMEAADRDLIESWGRELDGPAVDAGCGPGHWTSFLHERGVSIEGVDLVPEFVAQARQRFPTVPFRVGTLGALGVPDASLRGILAWYSLIHLPPAEVAPVLREFARCVAPGGSLLVGFFDGESREPFDHAVVTAYFWPVEAMQSQLVSAGFEVVATETRSDTGRRPHAAITARRT